MATLHREYYGIPKGTIEIDAAADDTSPGTADTTVPASDISAANRQDSAGQEPVYALIQCKGENINWAVGGTVPTTSTGTALGHLLQVGDTLQLFDWRSIKSFRFCNTTATSDGTLVITFFYDKTPA